LTLFIFGIFPDNSKEIENVSAQESQEEPPLCFIHPEINLPGGITLSLGPNEYEIPTGEATDQSEITAEKIMEQMQIIIDASAAEIDSANQMVNLAKGCSEERCDKHCINQGGSCSCEEFGCAIGCGDPRSTCTMGCPSVGPINCCFNAGLGCQSDPCSGEVCPAGSLDAINNLQSNIVSQFNRMADANNKIIEYFTIRRNRPVGQWWCGCGASLAVCSDPPDCFFKPSGLPCVFPEQRCGGITQCLPTLGACLPDIGKIIENLERSRSGDYVYYSLTSGFMWNHQPPGLKDCVVRPDEIFENLSFRDIEKCSSAIYYGWLEADQCYRFDEEDLPDKSDNFLCCEYSQ